MDNKDHDKHNNRKCYMQEFFCYTKMRPGCQTDRKHHTHCCLTWHGKTKDSLEEAFHQVARGTQAVEGTGGGKPCRIHKYFNVIFSC